MDRDSGWLMVNDRLDRESRDEYSITVTATDEGGLSSKTNITVLITDTNDSPPEFAENNKKMIEIDAGNVQPGTTLTTLDVKVLDSLRQRLLLFRMRIFRLSTRFRCTSSPEMMLDYSKLTIREN
jgi:hypothetical protein